MSHLTIRLLGSPQVQRNGAPIAMTMRKVVALLAYLAVTGRAHSRDALATLLWPESGQSRARGSLRHALTVLRGELGDEWLQLQGEMVALAQSAQLHVDVHTFHQLLAECKTHGHAEAEVCMRCAEPLRQAAAVYRGDLLEGFALDDSVRFDEWQYFQRDRLHHELIGVLERLVKLHVRQRAWQPATGYAQRWVALDPLDEAAQRQLMRVYTWEGRRAAALRQYRTCLTVIEAELGVEPGVETKQLYEAIRAGEIPEPEPALTGSQEAGASHAFAMASPVVVAAETGDADALPLAFVARREELVRLEGFLARALAGQGQAVFVTGEAGSGKTALMQEFVRRAIARYPNLIVAAANCNSFTGSSDPYLPFRELLNQLAGDYEADAAGILPPEAFARRKRAFNKVAASVVVNYGSNLIGTIVPNATLLAHATDGVRQQIESIMLNPAGNGMVAPEQFREQASQVLLKLASHRPLFLVLDDLQWIDTASAELFFHIARRLEGSPILLTGTYRPHEITRGSERGRHPLAPVINELQRYSGAILIDLDQASETEGEEFVSAVLDQFPNRLRPEFRTALFRHTDGHPLFTVELLRGLQERGDLIRDNNGYWVESAHVDWNKLPTRVEGMIAERISQLDSAQQELLAIASVEGETFTAEVLAQAQGFPVRSMVKILGEELDRRSQLVRAVGAEHSYGRRLSRYRLRHFLFQRYIYLRLDQSEQTYLHEEVGTALEVIYGQDASTIAVELAHHFERAGRIEKSAHYRMLAAQQAMAVSSFTDAINHCRQGLAQIATLPNTSERARAELGFQVVLGTALQSYGGLSVQEAEPVYERALELCRQLDAQDDVTSQFVFALLSLGVLFATQTRWQMAMEIGEQILLVAQRIGETRLASSGHWLLGNVNAALGRFSDAEIHYHKGAPPSNFLEVYATSPSYGQVPEIECLAMSSWTRWLLGFPTQALARVQQAVDLVHATGNLVGTLQIYLDIAMVHQHRRDVGAVEQFTQSIFYRIGRQNLVYWRAAATVLNGWARIQRGEYHGGIQQIQSGQDAMNAIGMRISRPYGLAHLSEGLAKAGDNEGALQLLDEALSLIHSGADRYYLAEILRLRGELLAQKPAQEMAAEEVFLEAVNVAQSQHARMWELRATVSLCRLWQSQGKITDAYQRLLAIYSMFSEGFDAPDLIEAAALLSTLVGPTVDDETLRTNTT